MMCSLSPVPILNGHGVDPIILVHVPDVLMYKCKFVSLSVLHRIYVLTSEVNASLDDKNDR